MHMCAYVCTRAPPFCVYSDPTSEKERKIRDSSRNILSLLCFYCVRRYRRLVPLGKCWRRKVAPTDLTIDKDASLDLLSLERRKEMSCSSHDKYLQWGRIYVGIRTRAWALFRDFHSRNEIFCIRYQD